jgi:hypothetical protein
LVSVNHAHHGNIPYFREVKRHRLDATDAMFVRKKHCARSANA